MLHEHRHAQPELIARRVDAGEHQHQRQIAQLLIAQSVRHRSGGDQLTHEIVARIGPAIGDDLVTEAVQLLRRALDAVDLLLEGDAKGETHLGGELEDAWPDAIGQSEQERQHAGGVGVGEVVHELAAAGVNEAVDLFLGELDEVALEALDGAPREGRSCRLAQAPMIGPLGDEDRRHPPFGEHARGDAVECRPVVAALTQARMVEEAPHLGVTQHGEPVRRLRVPALLARLAHGA